MDFMSVHLATLACMSRDLRMGIDEQESLHRFHLHRMVIDVIEGHHKHEAD